MRVRAGTRAGARVRVRLARDLLVPAHALHISLHIALHLVISRCISLYLAASRGLLVLGGAVLLHVPLLAAEAAALHRAVDLLRGDIGRYRRDIGET